MNCFRITLLCIPFWSTVACLSPAPAVTEVNAVLPAAIAQGSDANIVITGNFWAEINVDFGSGNSAAVEDTFTASVGNTTLLNVTYVDSQTLNATLPGTLPLGVYDLTVTGPNGVKATMSQAVSIVPPSCAGAACRAFVASITLTPTHEKVNQTFTATGSASDPNGSGGNLYYLWDWTSDGRFDAFGAQATHRYTAVGTYTITLVVVDSNGNSAQAQTTVNVTK